MPTSDIWAEPIDELYGKIVDIREETQEFEGDEGVVVRDQIVVEVEDLGNPDAEYNRRFFFGASTHRRSKWSIWRKDFASIGHPIREEEDLLNQCFQFRMKELDFGGKFKATNYPEPVRRFTSEEEARAAAVGTALGTPTGEALGKAEEALLILIDGKKWDNTIEAAMLATPDIISDTAFLSKLLNVDQRATLLADYVSSGVLAVGEDGTYHKVEIPF